MGPMEAPWGLMGPMGAQGAHVEPVWGQICPQRAPRAPAGAGISKPCCYGAALPRRGVFFRPKIDLSKQNMPKMVKKKLRLRGWDPPGEIRAEILRRIPVRMSKMVGWRPDW